MNKKLELVLDWVENMAGKGENVGYQLFVIFPENMFSNACFPSVSHGIVK